MSGFSARLFAADTSEKPSASASARGSAAGDTDAAALSDAAWRRRRELLPPRAAGGDVQAGATEPGSCVASCSLLPGESGDGLGDLPSDTTGDTMYLDGEPVGRGEGV